MFEARLASSTTFKKVLDAIKDLLNEACFDCGDTGIQVQAMDNSHVSLVSLTLRATGFEKFRCDRNITLGMNMSSLAKVFKCANADDTVTIKAQDDADVVTFVFESKKQEKISDYEMKLMNLDQEHLGIPETDFSCVIRMPSTEFSRICRDLAQFGETIAISCTKEGVRFSTGGDIGTANVKIVQTNDFDKQEESVTIDLQEPVTLTFSAHYLCAFAKATPLANQVVLSISNNVPLVVEYEMPELGNLRYYLAPKIEEDEN